MMFLIYKKNENEENLIEIFKLPIIFISLKNLITSYKHTLRICKFFR
jgi:hypothetical protein